MLILTTSAKNAGYLIFNDNTDKFDDGSHVELLLVILAFRL